MKLITVGEAIATRKFDLVDNTEIVKEVYVSIGKPMPYPGESDFYCPYQITGLGDEKVRYAMGIDAIQAIQLVMKKIGFDLYRSNMELANSKLRWVGGEMDDLGFPQPS